ncbi:hypothetical protein O1611_g5375 [Lasiodiplodia mahajangana]|uniref:Uncharacterized protein n=1 Tax=Lasiodiplodia mahajangana TaxID=1108764 RepID=A0ACC2JLC9_9PEZI|nr:hypothetical protein O1611_g5375 [Lasiodiplodia mahajangana]
MDCYGCLLLKGVTPQILEGQLRMMIAKIDGVSFGLVRRKLNDNLGWEYALNIYGLEGQEDIVGRELRDVGPRLQTPWDLGHGVTYRKPQMRSEESMLPSIIEGGREIQKWEGNEVLQYGLDSSLGRILECDRDVQSLQTGMTNIRL